MGSSDPEEPSFPVHLYGPSPRSVAEEPLWALEKQGPLAMDGPEERRCEKQQTAQEERRSAREERLGPGRSVSTEDTVQRGPPDREGSPGRGHPPYPVPS